MTKNSYRDSVSAAAVHLVLMFGGNVRDIPSTPLPVNTVRTEVLPPPDHATLPIGCAPRVRQVSAAVIGCRYLNRCLAI